MIYLIKFFQVIAILFLAFFWNKLILKKIQNLISSNHDKALDDSLFSLFSIKNEETFIKYVQYFYWLVAIVVSLLLIIQ